MTEEDELAPCLFGLVSKLLQSSKNVDAIDNWLKLLRAAELWKQSARDVVSPDLLSCSSHSVAIDTPDLGRRFRFDAS